VPLGIYIKLQQYSLKSVFGVRPVWLKNSKRVESLLWLYHLVELVQSLLEREVREQMDQAEINSLPLYPEKRASAEPTSELVLKALQGHRRHRLLDQQGQEIYRHSSLIPTANSAQHKRFPAGEIPG
jgi:hypothetical protein